MPPLFLVFTLIPLLELALLLQLAQWLGGWTTFGLILLTAFAGAMLVRRQGLRLWADIQARLAADQLPACELVRGLCLLVGGVLLITPGVLTDIAGLLLLLPPLQQYLGHKLLWLAGRKGVVVQGNFHAASDESSPLAGSQDDIIEGEYTKKE